MAGKDKDLAERLGVTLAQAVHEQARGRHYPVAWASLEAIEPAQPEIVDEPVLERPPPGVASVRPSVPMPAKDERADADVLAQAADSAFFSTSESGDAIFELMISDDLFDNLRCSICVSKRGVEAVFHVGGDVNLRRLLEAESGRLRASLEAKGLKAVSVRIEDG